MGSALSWAPMASVDPVASVRALRSAPSAPFVRDAARSYGDARSETGVIHGENLDAMERLAAAGFAGRFRCIYFDPPFNSGRRFKEYDDVLAPEAWREMIRQRLCAARALLAGDG